MESLNICVLGLGYIGLPTASLLATKGYRVLGVDVDEGIVATINEGAIHIVEPELDILVRSAVNSGYLVAATEPAEADVFIIAVPTPFAENHTPDLTYVDAAVSMIAPVLHAGNLVILESTSPIGTTERIHAQLVEARPDLVKDREAAFHVAHCPERVLPGHILRELVENDRIVGGLSEKDTGAAAAFYQTFVSGEVMLTTARTAELSKLVENSYRDVNIAFANELSVICHEHGINVWELIRLANRHPRVDILQPGPGVGGHCLAVDPWFIVSSSPENARIIRTGREVNEAKTDWVVRRAREHAARFRSPVIGCLGIAYKPDIDDLRESPSLAVVRALRETGDSEVLVCEPNIKSFDEFPLHSLQEVLTRADIVVALVAHRPFMKIDPEILKEKVLLDTCGIIH